jgi:hypothetical protein
VHRLLRNLSGIIEHVPAVVTVGGERLGIAAMHQHTEHTTVMEVRERDTTL